MLQELVINVNKSTVKLSYEEMIDLGEGQRRGSSVALGPVVLPLDQRPAVVYVASLGKGSQRAQWGALCLAAVVLTGGLCDPNTLPWALMRVQHMAALRSWLAEHRAPATANRVLSAVKGSLRWAWRMEQMTIEEYHRAIDIKPVGGGHVAQETAGRYISQGEKLAMLGVCRADPTAAGVRDGCILGLAMYAGLRREEIALLRVDDYAVDAEMPAVEVLGKGRKRRTVPCTAGLAAALDEWLQVRRGCDGVARTDALLLRVRKGGALAPVGISGNAVWDVFGKRAGEAGVRLCTPHDGRRTLISDLLDAGVDIATVQRLAGHSNADTTSRYDRRGERAKVAAVMKLHMQWEGTRR